MHHYSSRQRDMNTENVPAANIQGPIGRVTRARAKVLGATGGLPPLHPVGKQDHKQTLQPKTKRALSDNKSATDVASVVQPKRRAVLKDITNKPLDDSNIKTATGNKVQVHIFFYQFSVDKKNHIKIINNSENNVTKRIPC